MVEALLQRPQLSLQGMQDDYPKPIKKGTFSWEPTNLWPPSKKRWASPRFTAFLLNEESSMTELRTPENDEAEKGCDVGPS